MTDRIQRWQVGPVVITSILEDQTGHLPPEFFFPSLTTADVKHHDWLAPHFADADGNLSLRVQALVIEIGGRSVVVDPCVGNGKPRPQFFWNDQHWPFMERFAAAGFDPARVDLVVHTHVGPHSLRSLSEFLMGPLPDTSKRDTEVERRAAEAAGLVVQNMRLEHPDTAIYDIGAVVYFLRLVPWIVPRFTVPTYRKTLRRLHQAIERHEAFETTANRPSSKPRSRGKPAQNAKPSRCAPSRSSPPPPTRHWPRSWRARLMSTPGF